MTELVKAHERLDCPSEEGRQTLRGVCATMTEMYEVDGPPQIACYKNKVQEYRNGVYAVLHHPLKLSISSSLIAKPT